MTIASYPQTTKEIYKKKFIPFPFPNLDQELCKIKMKWNNLIVIIINKGLCNTKGRSNSGVPHRLGKHKEICL